MGKSRDKGHPESKKPKAEKPKAPASIKHPPGTKQA